MSGKKILVILFLILAGAGGWYAYDYYQKIYAPVTLKESDKTEVYVNIPTNSDIDEVVNILTREKVISDSATFYWIADLMNYTGNIRPGRYKIEEKMSHRDLLQLLRSGVQTPVRVRLRERMSKYSIAGLFGNNLEADSAEIVNLVYDEEFLRKYDLTPKTSSALFLPDTYEFYWNTGSETLLDRMHSEFQKYWTEERTRKAEELGLSPIEVVTLASIVEAETYQYEEMSTIAGVYLNRLDRGMKLQADPTVLFALEEENVQRLSYRDLEVNSPYNTYMHTGLPPGPINSPGKRAINSVLNAEDHNYLYFCAKADFSGFHDFSQTFREHKQCARRYQQRLNQMNIRR